MYKLIRALLLFTLLFSHQLMADVTASVDRSKIGLQETLYYTYSVDSISLTSSPDFSPLLDYFEIVESSQQNSTQIINGSFSTTTTWKLALLPKKTGNLYIPPITFDGKSSKPILITVTETPPGGDPLQDKVLVTAEIDKNNVYTNEQILLTITLYSAVNLSRHTTLSDPDIDNAVIKELKTTPGQEEINGMAYQTLTKQFAIFPQEPGTLVIPEQTLQGKAIIPSRNRYDPFNNQSIIVRRQTKPQTITVQPKIDDISPWIASNNLWLEERWSNNKTALQVGDSITRTIIITAMGVTAEAIPDINLPPVEGFKIYDEAAKTENQITNKGIEGKKIFRFTFIANQPGNITVPAVNIDWWNTQKNQKQVSQLKSKVFSIAPSAQSALQENTLPLDSNEPLLTGDIPQNSPSISTTRSNNYWFYFTIIFAFLWFATLILAFYWLKKRSIASNKDLVNSHSFTQQESQQAYKQLQQCQPDDDFEKIKSYLFVWLQSKIPAKHFTTADEGIRLLGDTALQQAFDNINSRLYKEQKPPTKTEIKSMLDCVKAIEEHTQNTTAKSIDLYKG